MTDTYILGHLIFMGFKEEFLNIKFVFYFD